MNTSDTTFRIWVDDVRAIPENYDLWCRSVNDTIAAIDALPKEQHVYLNLDHDAGDYAADGGDYIRILDYIEAFELNKYGRFSFHIHSQNIVGRLNMMQIIEHNQWQYLY